MIVRLGAILPALGYWDVWQTFARLSDSSLGSLGAIFATLID